MSVVTNVILTYPLWDDQRVEEVNRFFKEGTGFLRLEDESYGGTKRLECTVLVGAFNYLDLAGLIEHIRSLSWRAGPNGRFDRSGQVQMFVNGQEDQVFHSLFVCTAPEGEARQNQCSHCRGSGWVGDGTPYMPRERCHLWPQCTR